MSADTRLRDRIEDHSLERVPDAERRSWLALTWTTTGIVSTLVMMFFGALAAFVVGIRPAIAIGAGVALIGWALGWSVGHVSFRTGLSSTLTAREHGLGRHGSAIASAIFGFTMLGFLALENALLYKGIVFYFKLEDTLELRIAIYGALTATWVLLTAFGFALVARVASVTVIGFLLVLAWMMARIVATSGSGAADVWAYGPQLPAQTLADMGIVTGSDRIVFAVNVLLGAAGALSLVGADIGRYGARSRDVGIACLLGNLVQTVVMVIAGAVVMYAGMEGIVRYYVETAGLHEAAARALALQSPDSVAATFIIFGGVTGTILMLLAQSKAQVLNNYSASLALTNLLDASLHWRPGRLFSVIAVNVLAIAMLYGRILALINEWITLLGVFTTAFSGVLIADYYIVRRLRPTLRVAAEDCNWAGVVTVLTATALAHFVLARHLPIEFFTSLGSTLLLYPALRLWVFAPR